MAYQPVPISPFQSGLNLDDEPFLIPLDGFTELVNGHIKDGHVEKRLGYNKLGTIDGGTAVMGLYTYYDNTNERDLIGFNTTRAFSWNPVSLAWTDLDGVDTMSSTKSDFIWAVNWQFSGSTNRLYYTNGISFAAGLNGIRYYDGTTTTALTPADLVSGGARQLLGGKLLFVFKKRLVVLNTYETDGQHPQRARWSQISNSANWDDTVVGEGQFEDAPTGEHIISARDLQDQIVVFFTNSVWSLYYSTDPNRPFRWKKINDFRACDGKMASVGFDRYVSAIGQRGITATDGIETRRVDGKIERFVTNEVNQDEFEQVFCLRDYNTKRFWTLYPKLDDTTSSGALIYDDDSSTWSLYDIDLNVLGYARNGFDWKYSDFTAVNDRDWTYQQADELQYNDFLNQGDAELFIGGDTVGNVYQLETTFSDVDPSTFDELPISFSLKTGNWNPFQKEGVSCQLGYVDFFVESHITATFDIDFYKDNDEYPYQSETLDCLPDLGFLADISNITNANPGVVSAPEHGLITGDEVYIYGVIGMEAINDGPYTITVIDSNNFSIGEDTSAYDAYIKSGQIFQRQFYRTKVWKRAYAGGVGYVHQMKISNTGTNNPLKIHEYKPWFRRRGKRALG